MQGTSHNVKGPKHMSNIIRHTKIDYKQTISHSSFISQQTIHQLTHQQTKHGSALMFNAPSTLHDNAAKLLCTLKRNHLAMLKRINWFMHKGSYACCFETIEQIGADLERWGGKNISRTQAFEVFKKIRPLINSFQPNVRGRYRRTLNEYGMYVVKLIEDSKANLSVKNAAIEKTDTHESKNRHPCIPKTDTHTHQKPTLLNTLKQVKTKTKEKPVKFSNHVNNMLDSLDEDLSYKAINEYKSYLAKTSVSNPSMVMEKICAKHVATQAVRSNLLAMEKRRAAAMLANAEYLKREMDSIDVGTRESRIAMTQKFRAVLQQSIGR